MTEKPLFDVFLHRAQGVGHVLRNRVWRMDNFGRHEALSPSQVAGEAEGTSTLRFHRISDGHGCVEFRNVKPDGLAAVHFGEERILKSQKLGSISELIDNRHGVADVDVKFRDLFSQTDSKETDKSAGTSVKVSVTAGQEIEGVASFEESVETEAHAEISESEGQETTREQEGEEGTTVPVGKRVKITETRERADGEIDVTAHGKFVFSLYVGKHSGGHFVSNGHVHWSGWQQFVDVIRGDAPDNYDLARSFKEKPVAHADLSVLDTLEADVRYTVSFEGRSVRSYTVEAF